MKKEENDLKKLRHSAAHLLAHALTELYPNTKLTIGPATNEGFFYDFLPEQNLKEEDLLVIEEKMREIAKRNLPITQKEISKSEARKLYKNNPFKLELIEEIPGDVVGISEQGNFYDLCKGGHVTSTGDIKHFKLLNLSGAYWRADQAKASLQRITGTAFFTEKELQEFEKFREEAAKYDHRKLGKQLDLFSFNDVGPGFPFFHPNGKIVLNILTDYLQKKLRKDGYQDIQTPIMLSDSLWRRSGHYDHYKKHMYFCEKAGKTYAVRPMNCPGSIIIYKTRPHSYREMPLRLSEFGLVHRYELSGVLHGLFRVRAFTIDDAHIYCMRDQIEIEVLKTIRLIYDTLRPFGFTAINVALATKPEDAMGDEALWNDATNALKHALEAANVPYELNEGEGAFYGPKIEFYIRDSMNREWQCSTVQVDFFMPERFDLTYISAEGKKERTVMIHRAVYGSLERFFGVLLEHYKGKLPFWLAPVQVKILTITDAQKEYGKMIMDALEKEHIRVTMDETSDPIGGKIKIAQQEQVPWMLVLGKKELMNQTVTLRERDGNQQFDLPLDYIVELAKKLNTPEARLSEEQE